MAQQPRALMVVTADHPSIRAVATREVAAMLDNYLLGSTLTGKMLLADLMVVLTEQPKLQQCTPQSLFKCVVFAAQRKRSFGAYGVWIVPREIKGRDGAPGALMAIPQLSYQAKNTSARERGAFSIQSEVVLRDEKFVVHKNGGIITSIEHEIDYTDRGLPTEKNVVAGYGVIEQTDGKRFYKVLTRNEIDRAQRAAQSKAGPWSSDFEAMCRKTIEARMQEDYVGDFTQYGGGVAAGPAPVLEGEPQGTPGGDLADELFARAEHYEPTPFERATMMIETCQTVAEVDAVKTSPEWPAIWNACGKEQKEAIANAAKVRKAELQQPTGPTAADEQERPGGVKDDPGDLAADELTARVADPAAGAQGEAAADRAGDVDLIPPARDEDQPDPQDDTPPGKTLPAFPAMPKAVQTILANDKLTVLRGIDNEIRGQWMGLGSQSDAVVAVFKSHQAGWGKALAQWASAGEANAYTTYKKLVLDALKAAGFPHEV